MGVVLYTCVCLVIVCGYIQYTAAYSSVCEGIWKIDVVEKCDNPQQYPLDLDVRKRKLNRTHDGFSVKVNFDEDFNSEYKLRLESYEKCDGGYKASDIIVGDTCDLLNQFAQDNFRDVLRMAGVEPQDCPIPKGEWTVNDYVIDYTSLPEQAKCGENMWLVYIIKNNEKRSCLVAYTTFTEKEDDE